MKIPSKVRYINKRYLNRLTARIARLGWGPFAIVYHVGRKTGKVYETPIFIFPTSGGFIIALTYGTEVDWYKNVQAAGRFRVLYHHREYELTDITPVDRETALPQFPWLIRTGLSLVGLKDFVRMTPVKNIGAEG